MIKVWPYITALILACSGDAPGPEDAGGDASRTPDAAELEDAAETSVDSAPAGGCADEGAIRVVNCGNCGSGQETCSAGAWVRTGPCFDEGACAPATIESEAVERCGMRSRLCGGACTWLPWQEVTPRGECTAGETRATSCSGGQTGTDVCSDRCTWLVDECSSPCGSLRGMPSDAREVCVPAGPFIRGDADRAPPLVEIHLSTFAIDGFPVTIERYRECVASGVCSEPANAENRSHYLTDPDRAPVWLSFADAETFCTWDGDRRLPTDAETQKATRGPAPRSQRFFMGDVWDCESYPVFECGAESCQIDPPTRDSHVVGVYPMALSYYGLEDVPLTRTWTTDWYVREYYEDPASWVDDPQGPPVPDVIPPRRVTHGGTCAHGIGLGVRAAGIPSTVASRIGVRCARSI